MKIPSLVGFDLKVSASAAAVQRSRRPTRGRREAFSPTSAETHQQRTLSEQPLPGLGSVRSADAEAPLQLEVRLENQTHRILSARNDQALHLCLRSSFSPLFACLPSSKTSCSDLEESAGLLGTQERPELNLNQKVEVKRCSETGNQQDGAEQPRSTFPALPSSSSLIPPLSCFSHC